LNGKYAPDYQLKRLESSIRAEVQSNLEAAKVELKKQLDQLQNDFDQKFEKLRVDPANLSQRKDAILKLAYLSSQANTEVPSASYKEELGRVE
jgi:predicted phage gp36 major capsid-like protein